MKVKHLFWAALPALMAAACTNDDFTQSAPTMDDGLGKLIDAPMLGVGVDPIADTKMYTEDGNAWQWMPTMDEKSNVTGVESIGLCWTGVNNNPDGYKGPLSVIGDMVYTNVKFDHVGWLYMGETAPSIKCGELENGEFHSLIEKLTPQADYSEGKWTAKASGKTLDYSRGMFKSGNGTIYEGEYIVYFPYNDSFWNAPITAQQPRILDLTVDNDAESAVNTVELMSEYAFNVGYVEQIAGGDDACQFSTKILTSGIKFNLTVESGASVKEIVLWSKGETAFKTSQALSAAKIKDALTSGDGLSTAVYMDNKEINKASSTLVVRMMKKEESADLTKTASFYVPFLPTNIDELHILIVNGNGKVADLNFWETGLNFKANEPKNLNLGIKTDNVTYTKDGVEQGEVSFTDENYAYDEASFQDAYKKAFENAEKTTSTEGSRTVTLLDDITLTSTITEYNTNSTYPVLIKSDPTLVDKKNKLTLAQDKDKKGQLYAFRQTNFGVDVETAPQGCCTQGPNDLTLNTCETEEGTTLTINGGTVNLRTGVVFNGDVYSKIEKISEEETNTPEINIKNLSDQNGTVEAHAVFENEGTLNVAVKNTFNLMGATLTNTGSITVNGNGNSNENGELNMDATSTLTNNGKIYNRGDIDNNKGTFTNDGENAEFTDYVGSSLSGDRLENKNGADFICEVNSEERYKAATDLEGVRPTTILRFVYGENVNIGNGTFTTTYTLEPNRGNGIYVPYGGETLVEFESAIDYGNTLTLKDNSTEASGDEEGTSATPVTIGDLTVKSGKITLNHKALTIDGKYTADGAANTYMPVGIKCITGDMILESVVADQSAGTVYTEENVTVNVIGDIVVKNVADQVKFDKGTKVNAANLKVEAGQTVTFEKNNVSKFGSSGVNGVITNNGTIDIVNAVSGSDVPAMVWCNDREGNGEYPNGRPQYYTE